jgi:hypothetical protein
LVCGGSFFLSARSGRGDYRTGRTISPRTICEAVQDAYITSSPKPYGSYKSLTALCDKPTP